MAIPQLVQDYPELASQILPHNVNDSENFYLIYKGEIYNLRHCKLTRSITKMHPAVLNNLIIESLSVQSVSLNDIPQLFGMWIDDPIFLRAYRWKHIPYPEYPQDIKTQILLLNIPIPKEAYQHPQGIKNRFQNCNTTIGTSSI